MQIDFEGRMWQVDTTEITLKQAMVITSRMGISLTGWEKTLAEPDSTSWLPAVECLYWLMLQQDGQQKALGDLDFPVLKLANAFADAALAEQAAAAAEAEADPTRFAGVNGAAASPASPAVTG